MKIKNINLSKVSIPIKPKREDYFKAAVIYVLTEGRTVFYYTNTNTPLIDDPKVKAIIKSAVPGHNSVLLNLEIMSNVDQHIIDNDGLSLNDKIIEISKSIKKYVVI